MKLIYMIINYNDASTVKNLISQLHHFKKVDEILVVDNHSIDDSFKELKKLPIKKLRVIETKENKGYGSAINFGTNDVLKRYSDAYIVISNADIVVSSENDLITLANGLEEKNIGIVAPTITEHGNISRGWKIPTPRQDILENLVYFNRFLKKRKFYSEEYYYKKTSVVDVVSGCVFLMKASTIRDAGYFDENIFLYYEENIIAKKLQKLHLKSVIYNKILFVHNHSVTIDKSVNKLNKYRILKKSQAYFEKYYNRANQLEQFLLWLTNWIGYGIFAVVYKVQDIIRR